MAPVIGAQEGGLGVSVECWVEGLVVLGLGGLQVRGCGIGASVAAL